MELAIEKSLQYPWINGGWKKMLVVGGIFLVGNIVTICMAGLMGFTLAFVMHDVEQSELMVVCKLLGMVTALVLGFAYFPMIYGYFWQTISQAKYTGNEYCELPNWSGHWGEYYQSGIKFYLWHQFCNLPVLFCSIFIQFSSFLKTSEPSLAASLAIVGLILMIAFYLIGFFLTPFLLVPIYFNEPNVSWSEFISIKRITTFGKKHYANVLITSLLVVILQVVVGIGSLIGGVLTCCIGFLLVPSIGLGLNLSNCLMLLQAYELDKPEETGQLSA